MTAQKPLGHALPTTVMVLAAGLSTLAAHASSLVWMNCMEDDAPLVSVGAESADPERASQGFVCRRPSLAAEMPAVPTYLRAWIGPLGNEPEKNTLGYADGVGLRTGDLDE